MENIELTNIEDMKEELRRRSLQHISHELKDREKRIEGIVVKETEANYETIIEKFECSNCRATFSVPQIEKKPQKLKKCDNCGRFGDLTRQSKETAKRKYFIVKESKNGNNRWLAICDLEEIEDFSLLGRKVSIEGNLNNFYKFDIFSEAIFTKKINLIKETIELSQEEENKIKDLSKNKDIFDKLANSFAPSIYGLNDLKKIIILQLVGGVEKNQDTLANLNSEINILIVGDPGMAKSPLFNFIPKIASNTIIMLKQDINKHLIVKDEDSFFENSNPLLQASASLVCIDEINRVKDPFKAQIQDFLTQGLFKIKIKDKEYIIKRNCSILANAYPRLGRFDPCTPIPQQIYLDDAFLNAFDVIFIIRDFPNRKQDEAIASHVLQEHKQETIRKTIIDNDLLRKYIAYAKQKIKPKLTDEAADEIRSFYTNFRNDPRLFNQTNIYPLQQQHLTAMVKISEAHAKLRLSNQVTKEDAKVAIELLKYSLMQVGYDEETKTFDIDKVTTGITASKRGKIIMVKEAIKELKKKHGNMISIEELKTFLKDKIADDELNSLIDILCKEGDIFKPKKDSIYNVSL